MTFIVDNTGLSGTPFVDKCHPVIATHVNEICDELSGDKDIDKVLNTLDKLQEILNTYVEDKNNCQKTNNCNHVSFPHEANKRLGDLRDVFAEFGASMPAAASITQLRKWAELCIFQQDQRCIECPIP